MKTETITTSRTILHKIHFGFKSKKTIQVNMKKLSEIDPDLYKLIEDKKQNNLSIGMVKGGQNGKPSNMIGNTFASLFIHK